MEQLVESQSKTKKQPLKKYKCLMLMQDRFLGKHILSQLILNEHPITTYEFEYTILRFT